MQSFWRTLISIVTYLEIWRNLHLQELQVSLFNNQVSIVCTVVMFLLFLSETSAYFTPTIVSDMKVDVSKASQQVSFLMLAGYQHGYRLPLHPLLHSLFRCSRCCRDSYCWLRWGFGKELNRWKRKCDWNLESSRTTRGWPQ